MTGILYMPILSYLDIVIDAYNRMIELIDTEEDYCTPFSHTMQGHATVVVVFSTIALESYIYSYAARKLGENYAKKHIEKMETHTKWIVVPKLATGIQIPADHHGMELLQKLIKARNSIVHLKCADIEIERYGDAVDNIRENNISILNAAISCFQCIGLLAQAIYDNDNDEVMAQLLARCLSFPKYRLIRRNAKVTGKGANIVESSVTSNTE